MDFERLYSKLPDFIKYNNFILESSMKLSKKLVKFKSEDSQLEFQHHLLNQIFINSNIKFSGTLRNIQLLYLELCRFIDNVCKKYDIEYWLYFGSLLGAVRHEGFVPWDDDLDLAMMREDYEKLIEVLPQELSRFNHLKDNFALTLLMENEKNYFTDFMDIYDLYDEDTVLIDTRVLFLQFAWIKPYVKLDFYPQEFLKEDKLEYYKKYHRSRKYKFYKNVISGKYNKDEKLQKLNEEFGITRERTSLIADSFDGEQLEPPFIYSTDDVFPLKTITFENYQFKCPANPNKLLEEVYGENYMQIPSSISSHGMSSFVEEQFESKHACNEAFTYAINSLKEINENFFK